MPEHSYKLSYFAVHSKGEHLRWLLAQSGAKWENHIVQDEWDTLKPKTPLGFLPVLTVDGKHEIAEALVIGQYLAAELGLAGTSHLEAAQVFMLAHVINAFHEHLYAKGIPHHIYTFPPFKPDPAKVKELWPSAEPEWKKLCETMQKFLEKNGDQWLVGKHVSWADLFFAELTGRVEKCIDSNALKEYPKLKALQQQVIKLPNIKKYLDAGKAPMVCDF